MRLFAGVELEDRLRVACAGAATDLQERLSRARVRLPVRWVSEQNLHVTLWFLGDVPEDRAAHVVECLRKPWSIAPFGIAIAGAGMFPPSGPPRIVWLGVAEGADRLSALYTEIDARLTPLGFEAERRAYHPHVTIGRAKDATSAAGRQARTVIAGTAVRPGDQEVGTVTLFQSRLSPAGARYVPLLRVPLKAC